MALIPVKAFQIYSRLYKRFLLEPAPAGTGPSPQLETTIQPITNVDELLRTPKGEGHDSGTIGIGSSASFAIATVPAGKRWMLYWVFTTRLTGDNLTDAYQFNDVSENLLVTYELFTAVANNNREFNNPIPMDEGDSLQVSMSGAGSSTSTIRGRVWVVEEDAFTES